MAKPADTPFAQETVKFKAICIRRPRPEGVWRNGVTAPRIHGFGAGKSEWLASYSDLFTQWKFFSRLQPDNQKQEALLLNTEEASGQKSQK
jgi:hypothetical protein